MPVARKLIELHSGSIEAASAGPDAGSSFTVRLPLASG
jgi:signal transduction histidine kinase